LNNKTLAFAGAAALVVGLFTPIVTLPFVGTVNLFNNGTNIIALVLLALAAIGAGLALKDREQDVLWPGAGAAAILLYSFLKLEYILSQMRANMTKSLEGNPFAGLAQTALSSVQLQWGWIVLALGAGLLVYAGYSAKKQAETGILSAPDTPAKAVAGISIILVIFSIGWEWVSKPAAPEVATTKAADVAAALPDAEKTEAATPSPEKADYIRDHLRLYDLTAKYYDSMLDGRVPGIDFKLKNSGNRTLNEVKVRVVFLDGNGAPIAEEEYFPVLVTEFSMGDNKPLRPNYIWQNEPDKFYSAKSVPTEWQAGKVSASIVDIEFGPDK
jgi:hypothetical protein